MLTLLDRYFLSRFVSVFAIFFAATMGLFTVIDGFTRLDDFQHALGDADPASVLLEMARHYCYQACLLFDMAAPSLSMVAVMAVLALMLWQGELNPILSAGIPANRLAIPFVFGVLGISGLVAANQEWVIPRIADQLQMQHGGKADQGLDVEPSYDFNQVLIAGDEILLGERRLRSPEFTLPNSSFAEDLVTIRGIDAVYYKATSEHAAGWLIRSPDIAFEALHLTDYGRSNLQPVGREGALFLASDISADQLANRGKSFRYLSTADLIHRIRQPSQMGAMATGQALLLHERLTRPLLGIVGVFMVFPVVVRKESRSLVVDMAVCAGLLGGAFGLQQGLQFLATAELVPPDVAIWSSLVILAGLAGWLSGSLRT